MQIFCRNSICHLRLRPQITSFDVFAAFFTGPGSVPSNSRKLLSLPVIGYFTSLLRSPNLIGSLRNPSNQFSDSSGVEWPIGHGAKFKLKILRKPEKQIWISCGWKLTFRVQTKSVLPFYRKGNPISITRHAIPFLPFFLQNPVNRSFS